MPMQVNIRTQVNSKSIRREQHNGREHIVIPSYTMPFDVVMNGGLYPKDQIVANYKKLEGTLAPLGHPTVNGAFVSAFSPEGINLGHIGAWNRNTKLVGNRVYTEKWIDVEVAQNTEGGRRVIERVEQLEKGEGEPVHTSVAVFLEREPAVNADGYEWTAKIHGIDHDAILLDEPGAATPEQGVGLMVNADQAVPVQANAGALVGESFRERENRIQAAAKARFAPGAEEYVWVADFTDTQAVLVRNGDVAEVYGYATEGGTIVFDDVGSLVVRKESWVTAVVNSVKRIFNHQARPDNTLEGNMPLTAEEKAELTTDISKAVAANVAEQLKPLTAKVEGLETNHKALSDALTANAKAEEADKRKAVAAVHGDIVANALSGESLDAMFKVLGTAAPITNGQVADSGKPRFDEVPD
ncbi:hypothetical protein KYT87_09485 [Achromobacter sp. ES-001]|uniref:hypothetical protein n=1 Tax=Achromobacter sp. ES-001 TaxID=2860286 RepID=UPI001C63E8B7|nr:hypothetical protein [Achromobacter sp. ES-001]QYJ23426.1 hypothetical protein KYT87_09485 [Achromobacter sp. ES-001]